MLGSHKFVKAVRYGRIAWWIVIAASVIACENSDMKGADEKGRKNVDEGVVRINLVGHRYDIPLRYHYTALLKNKQWPTPKKEVVKVDGFNIDVLLPDLRPYSEAERHKFEERGYGDKVMIYIQERSRIYSVSEYMARLRAGKSTTNTQLPELEQRATAAEAPGLLRFSDGREDLFVISEDDTRPYFIMRCDIPGEMGPPFPRCWVITDFNTNLELSYSYGRQHLRQWREIDKRIRELFEHFAESAR